MFRVGDLRRSQSPAASWYATPALFLLLGCRTAASMCAGHQSWTSLAAKLTSAPYDAAMVPNHTVGTLVSAQIYVTSIEEVNEKSQSFTLAAYFRSLWKDTRLAYPAISEGGCFDEVTLPAAYHNQIWIPDFYFDNSLDVEYGPQAIFVYSSGSVYKSVHMNNKFQCTMDFRWLPFDTQTCTLLLASYSESALQVKLEARDGKGVVLEDSLKGNTEWTIVGTESHVEQRSFGGVPWDFIHLDIKVKRSYLFYMWAHVMPAALFVVVAWTGFFLDRSVAPARVAISVIPVLIMLNLLNSIYSTLPRLSYVTWMTSYLMMCLAYTVVSVFMYGLVSALRLQENKHRENFQVLKMISKILAEDEKRQSIPDDPPVADESHSPLLDHNLVPVIGKTRILCEPSNLKHCKAADVNELDDMPLSETSPQPIVSRSSFKRFEDSGVLSTLQLQAWTHAVGVFDKKRLNAIHRPCFRQGLRRFGIFYTAVQVDEIYEKLGLKAGDPMSHADLEAFLLTFHEPTMDIQRGFKDDPPSLQVDKCMRIGYMTSFCACSIVWMLMLKFY